MWSTQWPLSMPRTLDSVDIGIIKFKHLRDASHTGPFNVDVNAVNAWALVVRKRSLLSGTSYWIRFKSLLNQWLKHATYKCIFTLQDAPALPSGFTMGKLSMSTPAKKAKNGLKMILMTSGAMWGTYIPAAIIRYTAYNLHCSWNRPAAL